MSDAEVLDLLADYNVTPRAFFMKSPGGFSGTHRLSEESDVWGDPEKAIEQARAETIDGFTNSLEGNLVRMKHFSEMHTAEEVAASGDLQDQARALLSFRKAFELTIDVAEQGGPLIYSVEVEGSDASLVQIEADQRSQEFAAASESDKGGVPRTENPFPSTGPYVDPDVQDMDSGEVYEQIEFLGQMAPDVPRQ